MILRVRLVPKSPTVIKNRNQILKENFNNPIGNDDVDADPNGVLPEHENSEYDQVGNIYHTLENKQEREERYAAQAALGSLDANDSLEQSQISERNSYEDVL